MTLLASLRDFCLEQGLEKTYWVAYSGGLDSHVLLSLCATLRKEMPLRVRAIHINHGLSANAKQWALHCAQVCKGYDIDYVQDQVKVNVQGEESIEESARRARYGCLARYVGENVLLTAHHEDDQAETVLIQLLRGAGLKGLSAMPVKKAFARGVHGRPFLSFPRSVLEEYAKREGLSWIEDESNQDSKFTRNFIRHDILALLRTRWATVTQTIARSAAHCAEGQALLQEFAQEVCVAVQGSRPHTLSVQKLVALEAKKQKLTLRAWIETQGFPFPNTKKLQAIQTQMLTAACDRNPYVAWQDVEMRRYRDDLYLMRTSKPHDAEQVIHWRITDTPLDIGLGLLKANKVQGKGLRIDSDSISIRFRKGGEIADLPGRGRHHLKNLFQEWGVPPWERSRVPLVFSGEKLIAAVGYFLDQNYTAKEEEIGWELSI